MPNATLSVVSKAVAYSDTSSSNNPRLRHFDWTRTYEGLQTANPRTEPVQIEPGGQVTVFNGMRTIAIDNTTSLTIARNTMDSTLYRIAYYAGTDPGFRAKRTEIGAYGATLTVDGEYMVFNIDGIDPENPPAEPPLSGVVAGDCVYIPHTSLGYPASSPFNALNAGLWIVHGVDPNGSMTLRRPTGVDFSGASEVVPVVGSGNVEIFSSAGVQVGDSLDITGGFAVSTRKTFEVVGVGSDWVEVISPQPLLLESNVTVGAGSLSFYTSAKRFLRIEADQECLLRLNGDSGSSVRLSPVEAGNAELPGWFEKFGPTFSLTIVNQSVSVANVLVLSAE